MERQQVSLLLLHRAIDLFFQHLGLQEKLVIISAEGLRYANDPTERIMVTLKNTHNLLMYNQILVPDKVRSDFLGQLNAARNEVLYTHGASFPFLNTVNDKIDAGARVIRNLEGNNRWVATANELFASPMLAEAAIFDAIDDVDTYFEEVPIP